MKVNEIKEIVDLAKEKGFESEWITEYDIHNNGKPLGFYLWLCELQSHVREKHLIEVNCFMSYKNFTDNVPHLDCYEDFGVKNNGYLCMVNEELSEVYSDKNDYLF